MAQNLNSVRKHYIAAWTSDETKPGEGDYKWLAKGIVSMGNDAEDVTEDYADYTGVDTTDVTGIRVKWTPEGLADYTDEAQKIVIDKQHAVGDGRKVWHKWEATDGNTYEGVARLLDIKVAGGDSNTKEDLSFTIQHDHVPAKTKTVDEG